MHSAAILIKENQELKAVNVKQKRKYTKEHIYIAQKEILRIKKKMNCVSSVIE